MDVLPAQASAVSCERVFSSSQETCTLCQAHLQPKLLEALQMLKFSFHRSRLSFTDSIITNEADYVINGLPTAEELDNLLMEGEYDEIERMARNSSWVFTFSSDLAASTE
jgi:hypothetical protein